MNKELIKYLSQFITSERLEKFIEVIQNRTKYITVALEDIYQSHNASAVLRTCDCFGIQDMHIIENKNKYQINPDVALGSSKWLNLIRFNKKNLNSADAINALKKKGYRIIATTPHNSEVTLENFDLTKGKVAIFFGTELTGLSKTVIKKADDFIQIPMYGFTESFNISVSAAIILYQLTKNLHKSISNWQLNENEKSELLIKWLKASIKKSDILVDNFLNKNDNQKLHFLNK